MPALGWRLADGTSILYDAAYRLAQAEGLWQGFPPSALRAMEEHRVDGYWLSPSAAGGCPRQRILKITEDYTIPLEKQWTPMVGKAIHSSLEGTAGDATATESTLSCDLLVSLRDGTSAHTELRGTPDSIEGRRLYDYKTLTTWRNTIPDEHHIIQIQLYYYLCQQNAIEVDELVLWYIRQSASKGEIRRQGFLIEPWNIYDIEAVAEELAEPIAWYQKTGELPNYQYDPSWFVCLSCPVKEQCIAHTRSRA
jgi:CRISPR/Cas system-associated exonuclease Cas4 (RecB family)